MNCRKVRKLIKKLPASKVTKLDWHLFNLIKYPTIL